MNQGNDKEVEASVGQMRSEMNKLVNEHNRMVIGSEEYISHRVFHPLPTPQYYGQVLSKIPTSRAIVEFVMNSSLNIT